MRILFRGLPGSGKTTLAKAVAKRLNAAYFNADEVRESFNDWDFSPEGRNRQAIRMRQLTTLAHAEDQVMDFVCPTRHTTMLAEPDFIVWMNTIDESKFEDTNQMFETFVTADIEITEKSMLLFGQEWEERITMIVKAIDRKRPFDSKRPTGLMVGRFQPFHDGHKKLFEKIFEKQGQVLICVRDTHGTSDKDPFDFDTVSRGIREALKEYRDKYRIILVPNIMGVYYGREVGYEVERIELDAATESISATDIRAKMAEQQSPTG